MESKKYSPGKRFLLYTTSWLVVLLVMIALGEAVFRTMVFFRSRQYPTYTTTSDPELGSRAIENFVWKGSVNDVDDHPYELNFSTDDRGFRMFGNPNTTKKKVLFIGDSFTHAIEVSNDKTFYGLVADSLDIEVFAYGCRGYNTLQEWLLLEKYLPIIKPDLVVLQFCSNDFINNHYELESHSLYNNNRRYRPYLQADDSMVFRAPAKIGWQWLSDRSMFFDFIFSRSERLLDPYLLKDNASENKITALGKGHEPFAESVQVTERLLRRFRDTLLPEARLLVFTVDHTEPFLSELSHICYRLDIPFAGFIPNKLDERIANGETVMALDGAHWNETGHRVAAGVLVCEIADFLPSPPE
ncbi:MAG: SGNH/GDSL hydrolase family protein [Saprospiraceae bacterium]|nr:SGNH/GDSL hydrolase family protein [Saprospiraceae bacterium]